MKKLYIIGAAVVFIIILILALPEIGGSCQFYGPLIQKAGCAFALIQAAGFGAVLGGLLILIWKAPKEKTDDDEEDDEVGEDKGE